MNLRLAALATTLLAATTLFAGSPVAHADSAPPTNVHGDHTGDFRADLIGTSKSGELVLWVSGPDGRMTATGPWDDLEDWSDVTAIVQYDVNFMGYTDVLLRLDNGGLYDYIGTGAYQDDYYDSLLGTSGTPVGRNWNAIDAIIPIVRTDGGASQLIARNRYDAKLYLYDWVYDADYNLVLQGRGVIGSGWGGMRQIFSLGNFCGDSNPDLIGVHNTGILYCYALNSQGRSAEGVRIGHGWNNFQTAFSPGDLDGDGRRDLVGIRSDGETYGYPNVGGRWGQYYWLTNIDLTQFNAIG